MLACMERTWRWEKGTILDLDPKAPSKDAEWAVVYGDDEHECTVQ